jgi:hypothetical protein
MEEEKRDEKAGYPFKMLLEEALVRQRNEMMDNFFQILRRLLMVAAEASSTSNHFASVTPFKVQVNFDIPLFEGQIDVDAIEKWLNMLEGYYYVQKFSTVKRSPSRSLNPFPISELGGKVTGRGTPQMNLHYLGENTWVAFVDALKE